MGQDNTVEHSKDFDNSFSFEPRSVDFKRHKTRKMQVAKPHPKKHSSMDMSRSDSFPHRKESGTDKSAKINIDFKQANLEEKEGIKPKFTLKMSTSSAGGPTEKKFPFFGKKSEIKNIGSELLGNFDSDKAQSKERKEDTATKPLSKEDTAPKPLSKEDTAPKPLSKEDTAPKPLSKEDTAPKPLSSLDNGFGAVSSLGTICIDNEIKENSPIVDPLKDEDKISSRSSISDLPSIAKPTEEMRAPIGSVNNVTTETKLFNDPQPSQISVNLPLESTEYSNSLDSEFSRPVYPMGYPYLITPHQCTGDGKFYVPQNIFRIVVELWGCGEDGNENKCGSGGSYIRKYLNTYPGTEYRYSINSKCTSFENNAHHLIVPMAVCPAENIEGDSYVYIKGEVGTEIKAGCSGGPLGIGIDVPSPGMSCGLGGNSENPIGNFPGGGGYIKSKGGNGAIYVWF
jgi:hypothetical protein